VYLLDANACIRILNRSSLPLVEKLAQHEPSEIRLSSVVKAELLFGARRSDRVQDNLEVLARFFEPFVCLPFDDQCAEEYGLIRATLVRLGTPIGPNDLMIAATGRAHNLTLVSHNISEFCRVPGLRVQDWEVEHLKQEP